MENKDVIKRAINEIENLRKQNSYMSTRLKMFDDMILLLKAGNNLPREGNIYTAGDIVRDLDMLIQDVSVEKENNPIDKNYEA